VYNRLHKLFFRPTRSVPVQFLRYQLLGSLASIVDFGMLFLLTESFGVYYLFSTGISFTLGLGVNYLVSAHWVFPRGKSRGHTLTFFAFLLLGIGSLALNQIFMHFFTERVHIFYGISKLISNALISVANFFARRTLIIERKASAIG